MVCSVSLHVPKVGKHCGLVVLKVWLVTPSKARRDFNTGSWNYFLWNSPPFYRLLLLLLLLDHNGNNNFPIKLQKCIYYKKVTFEPTGNEVRIKFLLL